MSSQKNVPYAMVVLGTTLTRPALYYLIFFWQGLSFLKKIFGFNMVFVLPDRHSIGRSPLDADH